MKSKRYVYCEVYAIRYDGQPLYKMMEDTGFTAEGCKLYVESEGGFIDDKAIIHKGTAVNKELEELKNFKPVCSEWESMVNHDRLVIDGLAKDDFVLTKEEQIKAGLRKGKTAVIGDKPIDKEKVIDLEDRIKAVIRSCVGKHILQLMFALSGTTNVSAQDAEALVKYYGYHIDGNIICD